MSDQPLISVCIPCYNGARFIGRTLETVLAQTFTNFELLICDDSSTDDTVSVIKSFCDSRIKFTQNKTNLGLGSNWNVVLASSVGKYVKLLCEDDLLHPECLAQQVETLESPFNSNAVLAVCNRKIINANEDVILNRRLAFRSGLVNGASLIRKSVRWGTNLIGEPAVGMFRGEVLHRTSMCDTSNSYLSDLSLWAQLLRHGDAFLDERSLAAFRVSPSAASTRIGHGQAASFRRFARALRNDPFYRITDIDLMIGCVLSAQLCWVRNLFISFHSSRRIKALEAGRALNVRLANGSSVFRESGERTGWLRWNSANLRAARNSVVQR